jgi:hypothetical protein
MNDQPGLPRRGLLSGLLLVLLGQALASLLGGRAGRPFQRGRCPVFEPGENRRRIEGFRRACPEVCERLRLAGIRDGTLLPDWTTEQQARWCKAGRS